MADDVICFDQIYAYFLDNGNKLSNSDIVKFFKSYLNDPAHKDENRTKFKEYVNTLAHTRIENGQKVLILRSKYIKSNYPSSPNLSPSNRPVSSSTPVARQPPPYRPPPPVTPTGGGGGSTPTFSKYDNISLSSNSSLYPDDNTSVGSTTPVVPPRKRDKMLIETSTNDNNNSTCDNIDNENEMQISVKERTQKFNRMASREDDSTTGTIGTPPRTSEKEKHRPKGTNREESATLQPIDPKRCTEWYVTASRGDFHELMKLAKQEPRLASKKDPFTAYTVLHWGAKYGNQDIIKAFAGKYKVDVNCKTNGGYTPLHISAQFGHKDVFKLLIEVYSADTNIRDYSGRTAEYYLMAKERERGGHTGITLRKLKGRKKQSEKDLGFLRIGSLNVRVKKTTEAFSNFLGVTSSSSSQINPEPASDKILKGWGSADNVNKENMRAPKSYKRRNSKKIHDSGLSSTPGTPKSSGSTKSFCSLNSVVNDSDSDTACGFDSNWKN